MKPEFTSTTGDEREIRLLKVIEEVARRRGEGEALSDTIVLSQHPELEPELGALLRDLRWTEKAESSVSGPTPFADDLEDGTIHDPTGHADGDSEFPNLPGYTILERAHRGGQGVIYRAIQRSTKRQVAIKIMHEGPFAGPRGEARFAREIRLLAQLRHPNIVAIHDSGLTGGNHFAVMDYVDGLPLDTYMTNKRPAVRPIIELFTKICNAVYAAHLRGIIHRDLKPSNILIDEFGEPRVLDFGLAKIVEDDIPEEARSRNMTMTGQFVGSMPWASPEQADGSPEQIDVRTDVYSLGVVLYQVLTGRFPYPIEGSMRQVLANIMESEPIRPSSVCREIGAEVETIVLKCLSKERDRRYQSAGELAQDLRHYLAGDPIEAKRDSTFYVLRKQVRRYRAPLAGGLVLLLVLAVSTTIGWSLYLTSQQRLWESYLANARAQRIGGQLGGRSEALDLLAEAAAIRPSIELRNEAIAAMTLFDLDVNWKGVTEAGWVDVDLDPDLKQYALWKTTGQVSVRCVKDGQEILSIPDHPEPRARLVYNVTFSPNGKYLLREADSGWEVWDIPNRALLKLIPGIWTSSHASSFDRTSTRLALGTSDGSIILHNLAIDKSTRLPPTHDPVAGIAFHPDGLALAIVSSNTNEVVIRSVQTGRVIKTLQFTQPPCHHLAWSPDGSQLAVGSSDHSVYLWNIHTDRKDVLEGHQSHPVIVGFNYSSTLLFSKGWDGSTRFWNAKTGAQVFSMKSEGIGFGASTNEFAFSYEGDPLHTPWIGSISETRAFRSIPGRTGGEGSSDTEYLTISHDGRWAATGSNDGVRIWDITNESEAAVGLVGRTAGVAFDEHSGALFSVNDAGVLRWKMNVKEGVVTWGPPQVLISGSGKDLRQLCLSPDGKLLAVTAELDHTLLLDLESGLEARRIGEQSRMAFVAISPDNRWIATGAYGLTGRDVKIGNAENGALEHELQTGIGSTRVAFSPDGRWLATNNGGGTLWEVGTWESKWTLPRPKNIYQHAWVAFSPDGQLLAIVTGAQTIELVNLATLEIIARLESPEFIGMAALVFTPDSAQLIHTNPYTAGALQEWDLRTIREQLAKMNLDWDLPSYSLTVPTNKHSPCRVEIDLGVLTPHGDGNEIGEKSGLVGSTRND